MSDKTNGKKDLELALRNEEAERADRESLCNPNAYGKKRGNTSWIKGVIKSDTKGKDLFSE